MCHPCLSLISKSNDWDRRAHLQLAADAKDISSTYMHIYTQLYIYTYVYVKISIVFPSSFDIIVPSPM
jgi:hypothetical protein